MNKVLYWGLMFGIVCVAGFASFAGETVGLWTFIGEPGEECSEGEVSNLIEGAPADLLMVVGTTNQLNQTVASPVYMEDVPAGGESIFSDSEMTNVVAQLRTSVRVSVGSAAYVGSFLRIENFGKHVMTDSVSDDFTVEMFVRPDMSPSNISRAGLEGGNLYGGWNWSFATISGADAGHSPAFGYGVYNTPGGCLRAPYDNYGSYSVGNLQGRDILWIQNGVQWQKSFYNGEWHHVAFVYAKAEQKMSLYIDYVAAGNVKWEKDADKGNFPNGIPLVEDSFFQVLGRVGSTGTHTGANVAAVRMSKGLLPTGAFMRIGHYVPVFEGNGTMGFWTFDGEVGASYAEGTVVSNRVDGAPEDLALVLATTNQSGKTASLPLLRGNVPNGGCIYGDAAMTNVMAQLRTSVRVAAGSAADVGSFLRVEKLGRHVMTDSVPDDFTVEMFVRPDMSPSNISRAGLEGGNLYGGWNWSFATISGANASHSPAFGYGVYNTPGGCLRAPYDNYGSYSTGNLQGRDILWIQSGVEWQKSFYNGEWHHVAFVYAKAEQKMSLYIDYALAGNVKWEKDSDKGNFPNGIPLVGDSAFQVLGKVGSTSMHSGVDIAAVRIAKAAMPASAFMRVWHDFAENPTVAWWRFDEGAPGAAFGACTSVVASALGRSPMVMVAGRTGSVATPRYGRPVRTGVKASQNATAERNLAGVTGSANESDLTGLCLSVTGAPDLALPGSFTAEGFYRLHVNPGASSPSNRQPLMNESMADGSIAWGVRTQGTDSIVLMCCRVTNLVTRAAEAWYDNTRSVRFPLDKWHHVAVVYDDEARPRTLQLYLDYEAVGEPITFDDTQALKRADNGTFVPVGYYANNANISWCGSMDEFRFTRKALTPAGFLQASGILGFQLIFK